MMIPTSFEYEKPERVDDAVASLAQHGAEARVLAGGVEPLPVRSPSPTRPGTGRRSRWFSMHRSMSEA